MAAKGIHQDPFLKLGKAPAVHDKKNLKFSTVLKTKLPAPPEEYDFDVAHSPSVPMPMFGNDKYGDCVIAGRAHQTLRFELIEQGGVLKISDQDVITEYLRESGGVDEGLVVLDSLKQWRVAGWIAAGQRYFIQAFAEIDRAKPTEVKQAVFADIGIGIGLRLPLSAREEIDAGKPWETTSGPKSQPDSWGGHYVYVCGYTKLGPTCVTWGRKQRMSWAFFDKYCDEAYAIIDAVNPKLEKILDNKKLAGFLDTVTVPAGLSGLAAPGMLTSPQPVRLGAKAKKNAAKGYDFGVTLSGSAKDVNSFVLEDKNVLSSMRYNGKSWAADFKSFELQADGDLDLYMLASGPPGVECTLSVTFSKKKTLPFTQAFSSKGWCSFSVTINPAELKDE